MDLQTAAWASLGSVFLPEAGDTGSVKARFHDSTFVGGQVFFDSSVLEWISAIKALLSLLPHHC